MDLSVLRPGECFLAASTVDEWVDAMTRLVDDIAERARLGGAARQAVVDHYSFGGHAQSFLDALCAAASRDG
jgi:glycosyltransferase involved in cell wall biosynthesis